MENLQDNTVTSSVASQVETPRSLVQTPMLSADGLSGDKADTGRSSSGKPKQNKCHMRSCVPRLRGLGEMGNASSPSQGEPVSLMF